MPYNFLNKKAWLAELDALTNTYIDFINKLTTDKSEAELDIVLSTKYKSNELIFTGQEITDGIQAKLADDTNYVYEFRVVDNRPIVKRMHRVSFDDQVTAKMKDIRFTGKIQADSVVYTDKSGEAHTIKNDNIITTIEDLKSKYVEALMKIDELNIEINRKEAENFAVFLDLADALGGLYQYATKYKLILMLSRILKELDFYDNERGTQYSYEDLSQPNKDKVLKIVFKKVYNKYK